MARSKQQIINEQRNEITRLKELARNLANGLLQSGQIDQKQHDDILRKIYNG
jgi:hypothetical protein